MEFRIRSSVFANAIFVIVCFQVIQTAGSASCSCKQGQKCVADNCVLDVKCPEHIKYGQGPPKSCQKKPSDPKNKPKSKLEDWFKKEMFDDLFPKANIGWGPNDCWPYSYESFKIAARYFPDFGTEHNEKGGYTAEEDYRRDVAAFFAHAVQETGENDGSIYANSGLSADEKHACFYKGGFFNWFEGGPSSAFVPGGGQQPKQGDKCSGNGKYCSEGSPDIKYAYPCSNLASACYFGRGAIQISYNYNYGMFQAWLKEQGVDADLLNQPNLVATKMDPPLMIMASLWFYMTPQPPKPAMHDIILGYWEPGPENRKAGYKGSVFGPTSLIINNECGGEDKSEPGGAGESRRIKAFKWFCTYFNVPYVKKTGQEKTLSCKNMVQKLDKIEHMKSYQPDWASTWKEEPCKCAPAKYAGLIPYFPKKHYPPKFNKMNKVNKKKCEELLYTNSEALALPSSTACLKFKPAWASGGSKKKAGKNPKKHRKDNKKPKNRKRSMEHWK